MNGKNNSGIHKPFSRKIYLLAIRLMFSISRKHGRKDIEVAMLLPVKKENRLATFSKIDESLDLISKFDPRRYRQICRDVKMIWVSATPPNYAEWLDELKMCILDRQFVCSTDVSPAQIAATIVHEATHARLFRAKIAYTQDIRMRVEQICFKAELAFARRLPNGEQPIRDAEVRLQISENYWTNVEIQQRNLDALAELGKSNFAARFLYCICKRWIKRENTLEKKNAE